MVAASIEQPTQCATLGLLGFGTVMPIAKDVSVLCASPT